MKGRSTYLYRAVDSRGPTIDFLLSAKRNAAAAKRFFRKALSQPHTVNPRTITVDKNAAYPAAVTAMKREGSCGVSHDCVRSSTSTTSSSRTIGASSAWLGRVWALAVCQPRDERWPVTKQWE